MDRVTAIVTVYYPSRDNKRNIEKIVEQVDRVIICDNSPVDNSILFGDINKTIYRFFRKNLGLSSAFNKILKDSCYGWTDRDFVIFFDQDTDICENHVKILMSEYNKLEKAGYKLGCLGPVCHNSCSGRIEIPKMKGFLNDKTMFVKNIITSSMLCMYSVLEKVNFWNEEIFLDMADWDLCWRLGTKKMLCCMTYAAVINHSVGEGNKKMGLLELRVEKPVREYYQTRDCLYLLKKSYVPLKFKIRFIMMLTVRPVIHLLILDNKRERMQYIKKGIIDYRNGIRGELLQWLDSQLF